MPVIFQCVLVFALGNMLPYLISRKLLKITALIKLLRRNWAFIVNCAGVLLQRINDIGSLLASSGYYNYYTNERVIFSNHTIAFNENSQQ